MMGSKKTNNLYLSYDEIADFMPLYAVFDKEWRLVYAGPTLEKFGLGPQKIGDHFLDLFRVIWPRDFNLDISELMMRNGKIKVETLGVEIGKLRAFIRPIADRNMILINFSLGAGAVKIIEDRQLTSRDFNSIDTTIDMVYLIELQRELMKLARREISEIVMSRRIAQQLAGTDSLTGFHNRQGLDDYINKIMKRKTFVPFVLMMIDLDHFKAVNDTYGHAAGDAVLEEVAKRLLSLTRRSDFLVRMGGDEFAILLTELTEPNLAKELAERLIRVIELPVNYEGHPCKISASIGICAANDRVDMQTIFDRADRALYDSKNKGRGCVTMV